MKWGKMALRLESSAMGELKSALHFDPPPHAARIERIDMWRTRIRDGDFGFAQNFPLGDSMSVVSLEGEAFQPPDIRIVSENGQVEPVELPNAAFAPSRKRRNVPQSRLATRAMAGYPEAFSNARGTPWQRGGHLEYWDRQVRVDAQARHRCPRARERHSGYARIALSIKLAQSRVDDPKISARSRMSRCRGNRARIIACSRQWMNLMIRRAVREQPPRLGKTDEFARTKSIPGSKRLTIPCSPVFSDLPGNELRNVRWNIAEKES